VGERCETEKERLGREKGELRIERAIVPSKQEGDLGEWERDVRQRKRGRGEREREMGSIG
jgi:hypothetical protein